MKILVTGHFSSDTCQACDSCLRFSLKTLNLCHQLKQLQLCDDNGEDITVTSKNSFSFVLMALSLCCCPFFMFLFVTFMVAPRLERSFLTSRQKLAVGCGIYRDGKEHLLHQGEERCISVYR